MANQYANWHKKYSCANFSILILVKQDKASNEEAKHSGPKAQKYIFIPILPWIHRWMCENCFALKTKFAPYSYLFFYGQPFVVFCAPFFVSCCLIFIVLYNKLLSNTFEYKIYGHFAVWNLILVFASSEGTL